MLSLIHRHRGCIFDNRKCVQVPDAEITEPPSMRPAKSIKVRFEGEQVARWVALSQCEVVRDAA
jgi:hypothetical protein